MRGPEAKNAEKFVDFTYSDFVSVSLTAVTIVLAVVAVLIAFVAFWTVKEIKAAARKVALRQSRHAVGLEMKAVPDRIAQFVDERLPDVLDEGVRARIAALAESGELAEMIERASAARMRMNPTADMELNPNFDPNDEGER